ncbi:MAG TPA: helix-turn-helix transcriptional regulator [Actinomycetota bacterium]|nr:helix-turn-helix transcriptional regulator [Actinomycetota bacterium]
MSSAVLPSSASTSAESVTASATTWPRAGGSSCSRCSVRPGAASQARAGREDRQHPSAIARLEAGGVAPSIDTLERIAEALGTRLVVEFAIPPQDHHANEAEGRHERSRPDRVRRRWRFQERPTLSSRR